MIAGHGTERSPVRAAARDLAAVSNRVTLAVTAVMLAATVVIAIAAPV